MPASLCAHFTEIIPAGLDSHGFGTAEQKTRLSLLLTKFLPRTGQEHEFLVSTLVEPPYIKFNSYRAGGDTNESHKVYGSKAILIQPLSSERWQATGNA
jgi:hypothetical protein